MSARVKKILMERDGLTADEAQQLIDDTVAELLDYTNIMDNLGLEPDYLEDLL